MAKLKQDAETFSGRALARAWCNVSQAAGVAKDGPGYREMVVEMWPGIGVALTARDGTLWLSSWVPCRAMTSERPETPAEVTATVRDSERKLLDLMRSIRAATKGDDATERTVTLAVEEQGSAGRLALGPVGAALVLTARTADVHVGVEALPTVGEVRPFNVERWDPIKATDVELPSALLRRLATLSGFDAVRLEFTTYSGLRIECTADDEWTPAVTGWGGRRDYIDSRDGANDDGPDENFSDLYADDDDDGDGDGDD